MFYEIIQNEPKYFKLVQKLCLQTYPESPPWSLKQLENHHRLFPEGQLIAINKNTKVVVGMSASLIIYWDDYHDLQPWRDFTNHGMFQNHDPSRGRTLYGAEIMVNPHIQGQGVGKLIYAALRKIAEDWGLLRIRAGARMRGYHRVASKMSAEDYLKAIAQKKRTDPTLSFQLKEGFQVLDLISNYLLKDPESLGYAALIEWLNPQIASTRDYQQQGFYFNRWKSVQRA